MMYTKYQAHKTSGVPENKNFNFFRGDEKSLVAFGVNF